MLRKSLFIAGLLSLAGMSVQAEETASTAKPATQVNVTQVTISPEMIRYAVTSERREVFNEAMEDLLTDSASKAAFWEVYDAFEKERMKVVDARMNIIAEYAKNFTTMSDAKVKELIKDSFATQSNDLKVRKKYADMLAKKVNATVAGRFWQVDDFITSATKVGILSNVPLLGEKIK